MSVDHFLVEAGRRTSTYDPVNGWTKRQKGRAVIYTHPYARDGRAIVNKKDGLFYFAGKPFKSLSDAKDYALLAPIVTEKSPDGWTKRTLGHMVHYVHPGVKDPIHAKASGYFTFRGKLYTTLGRAKAAAIRSCGA